MLNGLKCTGSCKLQGCSNMAQENAGVEQDFSYCDSDCDNDCDSDFD